MYKKMLAAMKFQEHGNSQAVVEWVAIAALVLGVSAAAFAALGSANADLLDSFTGVIEKSNGIVDNSVNAMDAGGGAGGDGA